MYQLTFLCIFAIFSPSISFTNPAAVNKTSVNQLPPVNSFIINGIKSDKRNFYVKLVFTTSIGFCGGTVVQRFFVLTAAHCVSGKLRKQVEKHSNLR